MKSTCMSLAFLIGVLLPLAHAGGPDKDAKLIDGDWKAVSAELAGKKMPDEFVKSISLKVKNNRYTVVTANVKDEGTLKIDGSKKPKTMDIVGTDGPNKGKTILTIFDVDGDKLKVCYDLGGKNRPEEFATKEASSQLLVIYARAKP